jgi:hypothetical protein
MISKIKTLGLAVAAVAALAAFTAPAAQAEGIDTGAGAGSAILTGHIVAGTQHTLTTGQGLQIHCEEANLEGTVTGQKVKSAHVTATYDKCQWGFEFAATVHMNGCKYTLVEQTTTNTANGGVTGCTTGKQIQVTTGICTLDIPEQTKDLTHVVLTNDGSENLNADATVGMETAGEGIEYQETGFFCPDGNNFKGSDAQYVGKTTIEAFQDAAGQQQLTDMGHQFTRHNEGAKISVQVT